MKRKTRKIAKQVGMGAGIVGGVVAAGYAAKRLLDHSRSETPAEQNLRDAQRAQDFEPGSSFEYSSRDVIGDPSARTSVGLETQGLEPR